MRAAGSGVEPALELAADMLPHGVVDAGPSIETAAAKVHRGRDGSGQRWPLLVFDALSLLATAAHRGLRHLPLTFPVVETGCGGPDIGVSDPLVDDVPLEPITKRRGAITKCNRAFVPTSFVRTVAGLSPLGMVWSDAWRGLYFGRSERNPRSTSVSRSRRRV